MSQNTQSTLHQQPLQNNPSQQTNSEQSSEIVTQAQDFLNALSQAFESKQLKKTRLLERLFQDLSQALLDYQNSLNERSNATTEKSSGKNALDQDSSHLERVNQHALNQHRIETQQLEKRHHLLWLCNQARYYLTQPYTPSGQNNRALWQIRRAVRAIAKFRLLVHVRSLLPGKAPKAIAWRDILPGFKL